MYKEDSHQISSKSVQYNIRNRDNNIYKKKKLKLAVIVTADISENF